MIKDEVQQLLQPLLKELGYDLWGCEYLSQGKHSVLRVYIDKDGGIDLTDCERVSRQISAVLDVEDPIKSQYNLEISSPGIPRPLFSSEQYQKYLGHEVTLKLYKKIQGNRKLIGTIQSVNASSITLKVGVETVELPLTDIVKAHLIGE